MELLASWWSQALMAVIAAAMGYGVKAWRQKRMEEAANRVQALEDAIRAEKYKSGRVSSGKHERLRVAKGSPGIRREKADPDSTT